MARFKAGLAGLVWLARRCCWCSSVPTCCVRDVRDVSSCCLISGCGSTGAAGLGWVLVIHSVGN